MIVWVAVLGPFHTLVSKDLTYGEIRSAFANAFSKLESIMSAENLFGAALSIAEEMPHDQNSTTPEVIEKIREHWSASSNQLKIELSSLTCSAFKKAKTKFDIDWEIMGSLPIGLDVILPWTNR